ncbi:hypothetical protein JHU04_003500 [Brenneria sp. 4F2]|nr:hypothetical protein [Brenneria bubanii]
MRQALASMLKPFPYLPIESAAFFTLPPLSTYRARHAGLDLNAKVIHDWRKVMAFHLPQPPQPTGLMTPDMTLFH